MIETVATVDRNVEVAPGYRLMTVSFDREIHARPGQFAMLRARSSLEPLLRRALAVYRAEDPRRLSFLYQVLGRGTQALASLDAGAEVEALLPLGNSWPLPGRSDSLAPVSGKVIVVAGGIGSASVLMLCEELSRSRADAEIFFGAACETAAVGCGLEDFRALRFPMVVTTDDGSLGERGFVTVPLERYVERGGVGDAVIFTCGPWAMMKAVAGIAMRSGVRCLASLEAPMGCGFGVCVGCVVAVRREGPPGYESYRRVCVDGTIFPVETIRWEVCAMAH